jgi:hypothetical protein
LITLDNDVRTAVKDVWAKDSALIPNSGIRGETPKVTEGIQAEEPRAVAGYVLIEPQAPDREFVFASDNQTIQTKIDENTFNICWA